jgi:hypothetical protein
MSLINEALKQASRSQKVALAGANAGSGGAAAGGLRPTEESAPRAKGKGIGSFLLPLVLVAVLAASGWFIWQWWQHRGSGKPFNVGAQFAGLVNSVKSLAGKKTGEAAEATAPAGNPDAVTTSPTTAKPGNAITRMFTKNAGAPASPAGFPKLKLQGVYYRSGDSTALINGKNVAEGDEIEGVLVAKIEKQSVELQFQGETRVLRIH